MMNIIRHIMPPNSWLFPVILIISILTGLFIFLFYISKASSYLSDDPKTCVNCHIMAPQYATWQHSSHRERANCNDCHVPHDNVFNKYLFKAKDGMRHATLFTLKMERQVIHIENAGAEVVQQNCIRCHSHLITDYKLNTINTETHHARTDRKCWECHREVPHGRVNSLSSTPNAKIPLPESPVPEWLKEISNKD
ncbi:MAG: cytochrome c nitrite reductase small subunit [Bacteroidales bacterium]|nr:cytochrome c nitrite reductase small subunit [Bacteroidales bacterium]